MDNRNNSNPPYTYDPDNTPTYEPCDDMNETRTDIAVPPSNINHSPIHTHHPYQNKNNGNVSGQQNDFPQKEWDNHDTMLVPPPFEDKTPPERPQTARPTPPPLKPVRRQQSYPQQPTPPPQQYQQQIPPQYQQPSPYQTGSFPQPPPYQPPVIPRCVPPTPEKSQNHNKKDSNTTLIILITLLAVMIILLLIFGGIFLFRNKYDDGNNSVSYSSSVSDIDRDSEMNELELPDVSNSWVSVLDYNKIYDYEPYVELVENLPDNACFFLCDISGEGTPELFITSESSIIKTIYTLDGGSISKLLDSSSEENGKLDLCTNGMIAHTYKDGGSSSITYLKLHSGGSLSPFETVEESGGKLHYSYNGQRFAITSKEADNIHSRYTSMQFTTTLAAAVESATSSVNAYIETFDHSALDYFSSYLAASGDFDHIDVKVIGMENQNLSYTFTRSECNASIFLLDYKEYSSEAYVEITPYDSENKAGEKIKCVFPSAVKNTIKDKVESKSIEPVKGLIDCPNERLQGFDRSYVLDGGDVKTVRDEINHDCRIIAKNEAFNYDVHWYELWNSDNGEYYGWVDEKFINFNIPQDNDQPTNSQQSEPENSDSDFWDNEFWKNWFN